MNDAKVVRLEETEVVPFGPLAYYQPITAGASEEAGFTQCEADAMALVVGDGCERRAHMG